MAEPKDVRDWLAGKWVVEEDGELMQVVSFYQPPSTDMILICARETSGDHTTFDFEDVINRCILFDDEAFARALSATLKDRSKAA